MSLIKKMFSTPKRIAVTVLCGVILAGSLGIAGAHTAKAVAQNGSIGAETAENFAFADAGIDPAKAVVSRTEFDYEQGQFVYEVEFFANGAEYEYWIKATDGSIVKKKIELKNTDGSVTTALAKITADGAKEIALKDAGLSLADVTFTKDELDVEDGITVYDIEFFTENGEYEYEINAESGKISTKSSEIRIAAPTQPQAQDVTGQPQPQQSTAQQSGETRQNPEQKPEDRQGATNGTEIGIEGAKKIALEDAGISAKDVTFTEAKLDRDDGRKIYEIDFFTADAEYEYDINAQNGTIVARSKEYHRNNSSSAGQNEEPRQTAGQTEPAQSHENTGNNMSVDGAKAAALEKAGFGAGEVTFKKAKLDKDDGNLVYEIEFVKDGVEYEFEIDASSGAILEYDKDYDD